VINENDEGGYSLWAELPPEAIKPFHIDESELHSLTAEEIRECFEKAAEDNRPRRRSGRCPCCGRNRILDRIIR